MSKTLTISITQEQAWRALGLFLIGVLVLSQFFTLSMTIKPKFKIAKKGDTAAIATTDDGKVDISALEGQVLPAEGVELPITWGDLGQRMVADGVIDVEKFKQVFPEGLTAEQEQIMSRTYDQPIIMTQENSRFLLDMLWAFGLANSNPILDSGEMVSEEYGGNAGNFAATGGWTLGVGEPMDHYSAHRYVTLSPEDQDLVDRVSKGIYRPCCGNSTHFPDCNHGMAMLGLLELMAAQGMTEEEMYQVALQVNSYWFPQTYIDLATYFEEQGIAWKDVDAKLALSDKHSSGKGYQQTRQQIKSIPQQVNGGGGCGA